MPLEEGEQLPKYQTRTPSIFRANWAKNETREWLIQRWVMNETTEGQEYDELTDTLVVHGSYRATYEEALKRWPIRNLRTNFRIEPIERITLG